jgi:hypothetical protein
MEVCDTRRTSRFLSPRSLPVLDFQRGPRPRNYLARREQWRLLLLVLCLGLVVIVALETRKPKHYRWLLAEGPTGAGSSAGGESSGAAGPIDTRLPPRDPEGELPGTFISPAPAPPERHTSSRYFPGVNPGLLESIRDNKPLTPSEWAAWLHLFDVLQKSDEAALAKAATGPASLVQLFEQSNEFRGELVTTRGIVRRAHAAKTPRNGHGLTAYYQTWLWPEDQPDEPMTVWCLQLPEGFPLGMEIAEEAEVTGFYFKLWVYKSGDGNVRRAPILLAKTIHWRRKPQVAPAPPQGPFPLLLMFAGAALFAVSAATYVYYRTRATGPSPAELLTKNDQSKDAKSSRDVGAAMQQRAESDQTQDS